MSAYLKIIKICITNKNGKVLAHCLSFRKTNKDRLFQGVTV